MSLAMPGEWRIAVYNGVGAALNSVTVTAVLDKPGALKDEVRRCDSATVLSSENLANANYATGTAYSALTGNIKEGGWYGADFQCSVVANTASPSGAVTFWLQRKQGSVWDSNGKGKYLGQILITGASATAVVESFSI